MAYLETYQSNASETPVMRRWLFRGLVASIILHLALVGFFRAKKLEQFSAPAPRLVPRAFNVARLDVDAKLLKAEPEPAKAQPTPEKITLSDEKPEVDALTDNTRFTPIAPELTKPIATEKPRVDETNLRELASMQQSAAREMEKDLKSFSRTLLEDKPQQTTALLRYSDKSLLKAGDTDAAGMAAASASLDKLLGKGGAIKPGEKPLSLPGGAVFEFGSFELKEAALEQLAKLGKLIEKNPRVIFSIEGHTDSFGDDASNDQLSLARAEGVKAWLVQNANVDPARIQTRGFGRTRLVVPPAPYDVRSQASIDAEKVRQGKNRRVEIVFRFPQE